MALTDWLYISQLTGSSGTTTITVSAGTNNKLYSKITDIFVETDNTNLQGDTVIVQKASGYTKDTSGEYFTIEMIENGKIEIRMHSNSGYEAQYKINNGNWESGTYIYLELNAGDIVKWKRDKNYRWGYLGGFNITGKCVTYGNVMSLCYGDDFKQYETNSVRVNYMFEDLFGGCTGLTDASGLVLPAMYLTRYCYSKMFADCISLVNPPKILPAKNCPGYCYSNMFRGCTSLMETPNIELSKFEDNVYGGQCIYMFSGCTSITKTVKTLPATAATDSCYFGMYQDCKSLTNAPIIYLTTTAKQCCGSMFKGCTNLVNVQSTLYAEYLTNYCYDEMFADCTSLITAPDIAAIGVTGSPRESCCQYMFSNCTSLVNAPSELKPICSGIYQGMFNGCTSLVTAPYLSNTESDLSQYPRCYQYMFYNCSSLNYVKCLADGTYATNALEKWLYNVSPTGTFVKRVDAQFRLNSPDGIPSGWTVQEV